MISEDEESCKEIVFTKKININRLQRAKAFWKFVDAQHKLQSYKNKRIFRYIDTLKDEWSPETESSTSSETLEERYVWRKGLAVFQQLGLDKFAISADKKCKLCLIDRTIKCEDYADTVPQPYEELNADMKAFEQRQKGHKWDEDEISYDSFTSTCDFNNEKLTEL